MFLEFAKGNRSVTNVLRRPLGQPGQHLSESTLKHKLDIGFANGTKASEIRPPRNLDHELPIPSHPVFSLDNRWFLCKQSRAGRRLAPLPGRVCPAFVKHSYNQNLAFSIRPALN